MEYGKSVAAVPGRIDIEETKGCLELIKDGASMVTDTEGFVEEYVTMQPEKEIKEEEVAQVKAEKKTSGKTAVRKGENESDNMLELLSLLKESPLTPSELSEKSGRPFKWVASTLIILEVSGKVKMLPDGKYSVN